MNPGRLWSMVAGVSLSMLLGLSSSAQETAVETAVGLPPSSYLSPAAQEKVRHPRPLPATPQGRLDVPGPAVEQWRRELDTQFFVPELEELRKQYSVEVQATTLGGVRVDIVTPRSGIAAKNRRRVLINMHGGGFIIGAGVNALVESTPVTGAGRIKVISVDYRMGPEFKFPAASEDVAAVYREVLKQYRPENVGLFGCSAGGMLTAQAVAWFQKEGLPRPGAVALLCSGATVLAGGDSSYLWTPGEHRGNTEGAKWPGYEGYLGEADPHDPLVSPVYSSKILAKFPPTLILSGTRAAELSDAVYTDIQLTKAGVVSELHVWDGLGHGGFSDPAIPESKDAVSFIVGFFDRHLGQ